ncbi:hypothetical protein [Deinococcus aluminii]|uniref:Uncharacterized protein n=1 Tax=Deinococcus aluminii TaxID=1656885 RepID=A0ABP9XFZ5_9DEIO
MPLDASRPAEVYLNLNQGGWSIRQDGRVQDWRQEVALKDVTFTVRPAGRDRVRQDGHKQVHAWIKGLLVEEVAASVPARYNPLDCDTFLIRATREPLVRVREARLTRTGQLLNRR